MTSHLTPHTSHLAQHSSSSSRSIGLRRRWEASARFSDLLSKRRSDYESEDQVKAGMGAWLICSTICIFSLGYGQVAMSAYFLVLSCVMPGYVAKQLRLRRRL